MFLWFALQGGAGPGGLTPEGQQEQEEARQQQEERRAAMLVQVLQPQARERCECPFYCPTFLLAMKLFLSRMVLFTEEIHTGQIDMLP